MFLTSVSASTWSSTYVVVVGKVLYAVRLVNILGSIAAVAVLIFAVRSVSCVSAAGRVVQRLTGPYPAEGQGGSCPPRDLTK